MEGIVYATKTSTFGGDEKYHFHVWADADWGLGHY